MPAGIIPADYGEPKPSQLSLPQWTRYDFDFPFDNPPPGNHVFSFFLRQGDRCKATSRTFPTPWDVINRRRHGPYIEVADIMLACIVVENGIVTRHYAGTAFYILALAITPGRYKQEFRTAEEFTFAGRRYPKGEKVPCPATERSGQVWRATCPSPTYNAQGNPMTNQEIRDHVFPSSYGNHDRRRIPRRAGDPDTDHTSFVPNQATWGSYNMPPAAAMQELFKGGRGRQNGEVQTMVDAAGNEIVKHGKKVKSLEHILPACIDTKVSDWLSHCFHAQEPRIVWNDIVARMDQKVGTTASSNRGQRFESVHGILARNVKLPDCQHPEMGVVEDSLDSTKTPVERTHAQLRHEFDINKLFHFDLGSGMMWQGDNGPFYPLPPTYKPHPGMTVTTRILNSQATSWLAKQDAAAVGQPGEWKAFHDPHNRLRGARVVDRARSPGVYAAISAFTATPAAPAAPPVPVAPPVPAPYPVPGIQAMATAPRVPVVSSGTHPRNYFATASTTAPPAVQAQHPIPGVQALPTAPRVPAVFSGTHHPGNYFALASSTAGPFVSAASNVNVPLSAVQDAQSANNVDAALLGTRQRAVSNTYNGSSYAPATSPSSSGTNVPSTSPDSTGPFETDRQATEAANRNGADISSAPARYPVPPLQSSIQEVYTGVPGVQPLYSSDEESPNTPPQEISPSVDVGQLSEQERDFLFDQDLQFGSERALGDPKASRNKDKAKRTAEEADVEDSGSSKRSRSTSVAAPANTTQIASPPLLPPVTTSHTDGATPFVDLFAFEEFEDDSSDVAANSLTAPEVFSSDVNGSEDSSDWCGDVLWKQYQS